MLLNHLKNEVSKLLESSLNFLENVKSIIKTFSIDDNQGYSFSPNNIYVRIDKYILYESCKN